MMRRMRKKGQAEDFIADLIPSLIIIAIGLYVLSNMYSVNKEMVDERGEKLRYALKEQKTMVDYLSEKISIEGKEISLWELISLSYKNEAYQEKVKKELKKIHHIPIDPPDENILCTWRMCLEAEINYPDSSKPLAVEDDCISGKEKIMHFPTYEGKYIIMNFNLGETIDMCSTPV